MPASFEITVNDRLLRQFAAENPAAVAAALYAVAQTVKTESMDIVPLDEGVLKNSAFVTEPETDATGMFVTIGYGGAAKAYALVQHEDLTFHHPGQGQPKYLERPALARAKDLGPAIWQHVARILGR